MPLHRSDQKNTKYQLFYKRKKLCLILIANAGYLIAVFTVFLMAQKLSENIIINAQNVNKILDKNAHLLYFLYS
jgi:hypothetical protein